MLEIKIKFQKILDANAINYISIFSVIMGIILQTPVKKQSSLIKDIIKLSIQEQNWIPIIYLLGITMTDNMDSFTRTELSNFIKMLSLREKSYISQILSDLVQLKELKWGGEQVSSSGRHRLVFTSPEVRLKDFSNLFFATIDDFTNIAQALESMYGFKIDYSFREKEKEQKKEEVRQDFRSSSQENQFVLNYDTVNLQEVFDHFKQHPNLSPNIILGFKNDQRPTHNELKKRYYKLAFKYHPDKYPDPILKKIANEVLKTFNNAYTQLKK